MKTIFRHGDLVRRLVIKYFWSKDLYKVLFPAFFIFFSSCIVQFLPELTEDKDMLVVEGLITDQPGQNSIKLSTSMPLGGSTSAKPLSGCIVTVSDDIGNFFTLHETVAGTYTAGLSFQGVVGRSYTLHVKTKASLHNLSYQSSPVLLRPVPPIDSVYWDKIVLSRSTDGWPTGEGAQIYLNSHDPDNNCRFYRWEYVETWEFRLPYYVPNKICWITTNSDKINIKNTSSLTEDRIDKLPVNFITNTSDRLNYKYSILINQYSLNEDEYEYWQKLESTVESVGSLYDITPSSIPSNIICIEEPGGNVLGYFSVSAVKSKRIFIKSQFRGMANLYTDCENKTVSYYDPLPNLGLSEWVIIDHPDPPAYKILTYHKGCADCQVRGSKVRPDFWDDVE